VGEEEAGDWMEVTTGSSTDEKGSGSGWPGSVFCFLSSPRSSPAMGLLAPHSAAQISNQARAPESSRRRALGAMIPTLDIVRKYKSQRVGT
jgi:hypothetical protein